MGASATAAEFMLMATSPRTVSNPLSLCSSAALSDCGRFVGNTEVILPTFVDQRHLEMSSQRSHEERPKLKPKLQSSA
jgi:hypothetical protein